MAIHGGGGMVQLCSTGPGYSFATILGVAKSRVACEAIVWPGAVREHTRDTHVARGHVLCLPSDPAAARTASS